MPLRTMIVTLDESLRSKAVAKDGIIAKLVSGYCTSDDIDKMKRDARHHRVC